MTLQYDRQITLAVGTSRKAIQWTPYDTTVSDFYERLRTPVISNETFEEYMNAPRATQDEKKDVGGYVGGKLAGTRRKRSDVISRDLVTLDYDNLPAHYEDVVASKLDACNVSFCIYSTRKHRPTAPRLRVILPSDRPMGADEYEACSRKLAEIIGIQWADPTTFDVCRLMYWPSVCKDAQFFYRYKDAPLFSVDAVLAQYANWRDPLSWPQVPGAANAPRQAEKQQDPETKGGTVGAFCRAYDVPAAIAKFLSDKYTPVEGMEGRYTYTQGSTTAGAVVYEGGKFLYSHHATDPVGGTLVNAFDLVRVHKFGDLDAEVPEGSRKQKPSFTAMCEFAIEDPAVRRAAVISDFDDLQPRTPSPEVQPSDPAAPAAPPPKANWREQLELEAKSGRPKNTINNACIILEYDEALTGLIRKNTFKDRIEILGPLPWGEEFTRLRGWTDADIAGLYWYMENEYGINKRPAIDAALATYTTAHSFDEVQEYLRGLEWDGTARLDTLFVDYLGAEDKEYTRLATRKAFTAAVARAMEPGCKFDQMVILVGPQGCGKSTILRRMSKGWFDDNITTFEGKEASEHLPGVWIAEISELDAFRRTDVNRIKQFISMNSDRYRAAYGRTAEDRPRRCVFFGTCNQAEFLSDTTGNRRFWPIDCRGKEYATKDVFHLSDETVDQIWAEALSWYSLEGSGNLILPARPPG